MGGVEVMVCVCVSVNRLKAGGAATLGGAARCGGGAGRFIFLKGSGPIRFAAV